MKATTAFSTPPGSPSGMSSSVFLVGFQAKRVQYHRRSFTGSPFPTLHVVVVVVVVVVGRWSQVAREGLQTDDANVDDYDDGVDRVPGVS
jgi:hypothetical protein